MIYVARKRNVGSLTLDLSNINPGDIGSAGFDANKNVEEAKKLLEAYNDNRVKKIRVNFEDDEWVFNEEFKRSNVVFNYKKIFYSLRFSKSDNKDNLFIAVKCWTAKQLNENSIGVTQRKLVNIVSAFISTKGLNNNSELLKMIEEKNLFRKKINFEYVIHKVTNNVMHGFIKDLLDFLEFYNREEFASLINELSEYKSKIKLERQYRKLPSFKDFLTVKNYIDNWFEEEKEYGGKELLKYYPLLLWWNLTSIIPMRIIEFCYIKRNCFSKKGENYYITFPRMKYDRVGENRTVVKYDTLPIPQELYNLFLNYIKLSEEFGKSDHLISYKVYHQVFKKIYREDTIFNYKDLQYSLAMFYKEILYRKNKININSINKSYRAIYSIEDTFIKDEANGSVDSMINPGDLRHLAIINLMMQGYDKVEIQRLAGHFTEDTQYSYFNHMENWMDIEILKIEKEISKFRPINSTFSENEISFFSPNIQGFFELQSKKNYINGSMDEKNQEEYIKLDLGYCMDMSMPCPSFNWKHRGCYFCKHWSIFIPELEEKRNLIAHDLNLLYDETRGKIKFIQSLFMSQFDNSENVNLSVKKDLSSTSKEIQLSVKRIAELKSMLGVLDHE